MEEGMASTKRDNQTIKVENNEKERLIELLRKEKDDAMENM